MQVFGEYQLVEFEQLKGGELILFPYEGDQYLGMKVGSTKASDPRMLVLGKIGDPTPVLRIWRDDFTLPRYVLNIDKVARIVPDPTLRLPTPRPWGTMFIGATTYLRVAENLGGEERAPRTVDLRTGKYEPGAVMNIEYPVAGWSIVLDQPTGPIVLLRHEPAVG
jgi:hypothetical protein